MTKRKSLDELTDDITSMSNDSQDGAGKRAAALRMSKAKKASLCYETITFTDLAAWPDVVTYATVSDRLNNTSESTSCGVSYMKSVPVTI
jgi:hypothetical protein